MVGTSPFEGWPAITKAVPAHTETGGIGGRADLGCLLSRPGFTRPFIHMLLSDVNVN